MKTKTNRGTKKMVTASATGCNVVDAPLSTWENLPTEAYTGHCAQLKVGTMTALGFEQPDNALETLAVQLETLAAKVRKLKSTSVGASGTKVRVRVTDILGNVAFVYGAGERWSCVSSNGTPLALSYAGIARETECRFALEDCKTADEVLATIRKFSSSKKIELVEGK